MSHIEVRSITEQVVEAIRDGIRTGRFKPEEHHSVQTFAEALGVSRTPVREALLRLEGVGMVRFARNRGIQILQPTVHDLEEIFQLRLMIEPPAAGRAALRASAQTLEPLHNQIKAMEDAVAVNDFNVFIDHDVRFHSLVLALAGNNRLCDFVGNLRDTTRTLGDYTLLREATSSKEASAFGLPSSLGEVMHAHEPVLTALEAGDPEAAATSMYKHVEDTGQLLMQYLAEVTGHPEEFDPNWAAGITIPYYTAE